jgi:hypothetical protein
MHVIDAKIQTKVYYTGPRYSEVDRVEVWWEGGEVAAVTGAILENANPAYVKRDGNRISLAGQLEVEIIEHDKVNDIYFVKRVEGDGPQR